MNAHITIEQLSNGYLVRISGQGPYHDPDDTTGSATHFATEDDLATAGPAIIKQALTAGNSWREQRRAERRLQAEPTAPNGSLSPAGAQDGSTQPEPPTT